MSNIKRKKTVSNDGITAHVFVANSACSLADNHTTSHRSRFG